MANTQTSNQVLMTADTITTEQIDTLTVHETVKRTGKLQSKDATLSHYRDLLVRELDDGSVEYLVGDSSRRRDGWATLPADFLSLVRWD